MKKAIPEATLYRIIPADSCIPLKSFLDQKEAETAIKVIATQMSVKMDAYEIYAKPCHQVVHYSLPSLA